LTDEFDVSEEIYYSKMSAIKDNLERVKDMEILEDFIYKNYLEN
jgi:CRISPR/Cas system CMR-associated protein Cmr3 (group 5 of RAMP superfamily)